MKITRRRFLQGVFGMAAAPALAGLYTFQVEPYWIDYAQVSMALPHLPTAMVGKKIVQLSDLHIGNRFDWGYMRRVFAKIEEMAPEFVVYTGDFVSYESAEQFDQLSEVLQYAPHGRLGSLAVLGNHDYGHGWGQPEVGEIITARLEAGGLTVLRNEQRVIDGVQFIGIDDFWGPNYDPLAALAQRQQEMATVTLCHNPDVADEPIWGDYQGWMLSGHTHGGQVSPPFIGPPFLPVRNHNYVEGTYEVANGRFLYINRALGHTIPVRFNVRPEVTIFTLEKV